MEDRKPPPFFVGAFSTGFAALREVVFLVLVLREVVLREVVFAFAFGFGASSTGFFAARFFFAAADLEGDFFRGAGSGRGSTRLSGALRDPPLSSSGRMRQHEVCAAWVIIETSWSMATGA